MHTCPSCSKGKLTTVSVIQSSLKGFVVCPECGEKIKVVQPKLLHILLLYMAFSFVIFNIAPGLAIEVSLLLVWSAIVVAMIVFQTKLEGKGK